MNKHPYNSQQSRLIEQLQADLNVRDQTLADAATESIEVHRLETELERLKSASQWVDIARHTTQEQLQECEQERLQLSENVRNLRAELTERDALLRECAGGMPPWSVVSKIKLLLSASAEPAACGYSSGDWECRPGGYLFDAGTGEGYDPDDCTHICPQCRTKDFLEAAKEDAESTSSYSNNWESGTGLTIWNSAEREALKANCPAALKALAELGPVKALDDEEIVICNIQSTQVERDERARCQHSNVAPRSQIVEGLINPGPQFKTGSTLRKIENTPTTGNHHPTVKPTDLMAYLLRLVTPPGGIVLDPFMGSGSTGKAAMREGFHFIGCELDPEYLAIARARIEHEFAKALRALGEVSWRSGDTAQVPAGLIDQGAQP